MHLAQVHLAQVNIARLTHPIDHPATAGFVEALEPGAAVLAELEQRAAALGVATMQLETGPGRHGAAFRFERAGYEYCDCWGDYAGKPFSVCMSKTLP